MNLLIMYVFDNHTSFPVKTHPAMGNLLEVAALVPDYYENKEIWAAALGEQLQYG